MHVWVLGKLESVDYCVYIKSMDRPQAFTFDPKKNATNEVQHGIGFEQAEAFDFETAVVTIDNRWDYGEIREIASGLIGDRVHILVFTRREPNCHIISLRKANKREARSYAEKVR